MLYQANTNAEDCYGRTPLMYAVRAFVNCFDCKIAALVMGEKVTSDQLKKFGEIAAALLEQGADPNKTEGYGNTALHIVVKSSLSDVRGLGRKYDSLLHERLALVDLLVDCTQTDYIRDAICSVDGPGRTKIKKRLQLIVAAREREQQAAQEVVHPAPVVPLLQVPELPAYAEEAPNVTRLKRRLRKNKVTSANRFIGRHRAEFDAIFSQDTMNSVLTVLQEDAQSALAILNSEAPPTYRSGDSLLT